MEVDAADPAVDAVEVDMVGLAELFGAFDLRSLDRRLKQASVERPAL